MSAPALGAMKLEILREFKPLLIGDGRASAPRPARSRRRPRVAIRGSYIGLGEGDLLTTGNGLRDGWLRESMLEMSEGDSERFGGGVRAFLSHSFDSKSPIFPQAQQICRSLSEGAGN
jgi:hypothetical protein